MFILGRPPILPFNATEIAYPQEAVGDYYLHWQNDAYLLCDRQNRHQPLSIDFTGKNYLKRTGEEFLPKALRGLSGVSIADATAGWGKDAWLLASRGFSLTLYERNSYLFTLLSHALDRARENPDCAEIAGRITLYFADATKVLPEKGFDVIYLDPMYPERRKKAKVKKQMQALQLLLSEDEKGEEILLEKALFGARKRVIVKRPQFAPSIIGKKPSYAINGPNTRYDIYVI